MSTSTWLSFVLGTVLVVAGVLTTPAAQSNGGPGIIQGNVKSADGTPMEGVIVSARAADKSFTTSVFTDRQGNYMFPPLDAGQYKLWAQAVGFEAARSDVALAGARVDRHLTLTPIKDVGKIVKQMSGVEYLMSLPQSTPADRRMVHAFKNNCTGCHTASYPLQNRWDSHGWGVLVDLMTVFPSSGVPVPAMRPTPNEPGSRMIAAYRDELAEYLGRVRGATELSDLKLVPRPTGEATQGVVTEYDLPRTDRPNHFDDGSDWSMGTPSRFVGRAAHDVWADADGNIWMADDMVPRRTFAKLDPRTGQVTDYALKGHDGKTIATHSVVVDHTGKVWATGEGNFVMLDTRTGQLKEFPRPAGMRASVGGTLDVDSKGNPWATSLNGAITLDPGTGRYTHYEGPPAPEGLCGSECGGWGTYGNRAAGFLSYLPVREKAHATIAKPGTKIPVAGLDVHIVSSAGELIASPLPGVRRSANPLCSNAQRKEQDNTPNNFESIGAVVEYGRFRYLDLADLTWNQEVDLVCPANLLGTVSVYRTSRHGGDYSGAQALVHSVRPRIAVMNNNPTKGGTPDTFRIVKSSPGIEDFWQLHYSDNVSTEVNSPEQFIANFTGAGDGGHYIKLSARSDGSFTVTNGRNGFAKQYPAPTGVVTSSR